MGDKHSSGGVRAVVQAPATGGQLGAAAAGSLAKTASVREAALTVGIRGSSLPVRLVSYARGADRSSPAHAPYRQRSPASASLPLGVKVSSLPLSSPETVVTVLAAAIALLALSVLVVVLSAQRRPYGSRRWIFRRRGFMRRF